MKLKKTAAFVIALGMIVGLLSVFPAAALEPVTGYAQEILIDESFDTGTYDSNVLKIENGEIKDGAVNFELSGESGFSLNKTIDLTSVKQYVIDFELATDVTYTDPWTATFIGARNVQTQSAPWDAKNGTWLGITKDRLILWHSCKDSGWGTADVTKGKNYTLVDNGFDVSNAAYRVIYEDSVAEIWIKDLNSEEAAYELMATITTVTDDKKNYGSITVVEKTVTTTGGTTAPESTTTTTGTTTIVARKSVTLQSAIPFTETQSGRYFSVWSYKAQDPADDPLAPTPKPEKTEKDESTGAEEGTTEGATEGTTEGTTEGAEEAVETVKTVKLGSFKAVRYTEPLMTEAQKTDLEAKKSALQEVVDGESSYLASSIDETALNAVIDKIDELLAKENALASEYDEIAAEVTAVFGNLIDDAAVTAYLARFAGFESVLNDMKGSYPDATIANIAAAIEAAKAVVNAEEISPAIFDAEFNKVASLFSAAGVYTQNGIPAYSRDFTKTGYTLSDFASEWYDRGGSNKDTYAVSGENGALVDWKVDGVVVGRESMQFKKAYSNYSVKATLTKTRAGKMVMSVRAPYGQLEREEDNYKGKGTGNSSDPSFTGVPGAGSTATVSIASNSANFETVYVFVRTVTMASNNPTSMSREVFTYNLTDTSTFPGVLSNDNKTATFKIKDMDDLVEIYVEGKDDEGKTIDVPLATVRFSLELTGGKYTKGTFVNEVDHTSVEFSGMSIPKAENGYITFASRMSGFGVENVEICTNVAPKENAYASDGKSDPNTVELKTEGDSFDFTVGTAKSFTVDAQFDNLKTYGKEEYKAGTINVSTSSSTKVCGTVGEDGNDILAVDAAAGTLKGVRRGTDVLTATYTGINKTFTCTEMVTVERTGYTAPAETNLFDKTISSAKIVNDKAFKSVDKGFGIIPVISYTLPNGTGDYLSDEYYVGYVSSDDSIIAWDDATGKFVAKAAGVARVRAEVGYGTAGNSFKTDEVSVEVVAAGNMTPGVSTTASVKNLVEGAKDSGVTAEQFAELIDAAIEAGVDISYGEKDADKLINAQLIKNELAALTGDVTEEDIAAAVATALEVRKVYDVRVKENATADDLVSILFTGGNKNSIGADLTAYAKLSSTKKSRAVLRVFAQLKKVDADALSSKKLSDIMDDVIDAVAKGGGSGTGSVTRTDSTSGGSFGAGASFSGAASSGEGKKLLAGDEAIARAEQFADVNGAAWAKEAIGAFVYEGVVSGYEDGTVRPNNEITRDEFIKLLVCALGIDINASATNIYSDIPAGSWQIPYVAAGVNAGIVNGTGTLTFGSGENITRQDMATMIYRAALKLGISLTNDKLAAFKDAEMIAGYAADAVSKLAASGVITGMGDDTFAPAANATRAQAISMLYILRSLMK